MISQRQALTENAKAPVRIGAGAGFAGDRIDPAVELVTKGALDALVFEVLAERTIALAQRRRRTGSGPGFDDRLQARLGAPTLTPGACPCVKLPKGWACPAAASLW